VLKTAVIAVNIRVIVQPDKRSPAPGPVDFDVKREELLSQEVCHVVSPGIVASAMRRSNVLLFVLVIREGGTGRVRAAGGKGNNERYIF